MSETPKFSFGTPATTGGSAGSLFANAGADKSATPTTSIFGQTNTTNQQSGTSLFGNNSSNTGSLFGSNPAATTATNLFGSTATSGAPQQQTSLFGSTTPASQPSKNLFGGGGGGGPGGIFGQAATSSSPATTSAITGPVTSAGSIFNKPPTPGQSSPATTTPTFSFGQSTQPAASQPSQTTMASQQPSSAAGGLFGTAANSAPKSASEGVSLFGGNVPGGGSNAITPQKPAGLSFSTTPAGNPPSSNVFGSNFLSTAASNPSASASAAPPAATSTATSSLFGASKPSIPTTGTTSLFGSGTPASAATPNLFGAIANDPKKAIPAAPSTTSTPSLFGAVSGAASQTATTTSAVTPSLFGGAAVGATSSASSAQPAPTTTTAAPSAAGNLFGAVASNPQSSASTPSAVPQTASNLFGAPAAAKPATSTPSLFTTPATTTAGATNTTAAAPTSGTTATAQGATSTLSGGAASTAGAAPPSQSRLAQKTMDEIITSWSTSLSTHQKSFQSLAKQVSTWDRSLVENSTKITQLYGRCFQAERDCSEVERQLSNVEHSQLELEAMLEKYENEVDRILDQGGMGESGSGIGGVDAERERTYKTAESCATRLNEMGQSLTSMIEEINSASTKLSTNNSASGAKTDDPLSQIVRVLNQHLSQLQAIDSGAAALQGRVSAAQADARSLGQSQSFKGSSRAVDDFGRSYLGRI